MHSFLRPFVFMTRRVLLAVSLLLLSVSYTFGQGKIAGRVTDGTTGESLIGVNVVISGTQQGTTTDLDGNYVIVNVRPGDYSLRFSYIGFQPQLITDVRATTGQTTRIDLRMSEQVIEGEEIIVVAERPLIQRDLTASKKTVVSDDIEKLPVEGFFGVLVTQAGVTQDAGGAIHIRGGRSNEVAYLVDGMSVSNPFNTNGLATEVAADAIQEMTVISGAFNAEYGKAMSGIVNLVTKEGGNNIEGSFSFYGGETVTAHGDLFNTPSGYGLKVYTMEGSLSGPLPFFRDMNFFISARRDVDEGHIFGFREHLPSDSANFNPDPDRMAQIQQYIPDYKGPDWYYEFHGQPWYTLDDASQLPNEVVSMNPRESYNILGKITMRPFIGTKIEYSQIRDGGKHTPFSFAHLYNPDGVGESRDWSFNHSLHWTHTLDDRMFYTLKMSYAKNYYHNYLYQDTTDVRYVKDLGGTGMGTVLGFFGSNFLFAGNQKDHTYEDSRSVRTKFDFTRQFGIVHEVKMGVDVQLHRLNRENFVVLYDGVRYRKPTVEPVDNPSHDQYIDQKVAEISAYAQDKIELQDFIINVGLRYERFVPNGNYIPNLIEIDAYLDDLLEPWEDRLPLGQATTKHMWLPRIGVSFPITNRGIIHFSYGHFAQMPSMRNMYLNPEFEFPVGSVPTFGNTNMRPERTVQYEIGLQQQITDLLAFDITGYFKDIRDYLTSQRIRYSTIAGESEYRIYLNKDYANVKGVTFALTKRRARNGLLSGTLDYTYMVAEGNNNATDAFFFNYLSGRENEFEVVPLDFDQRHVISSTITISRPGSWGISFIGQYATGYPYTPVLIDQTIDDLPNSGRKPVQIKLDTHLYKDFRFGNVRLRTFAKVFNLLDRLNERYVFNETGRATYSLNEELNTHATWETAYGLPGIHTLEEYDNKMYWYSAPREIRIGLTLGF